MRCVSYCTAEAYQVREWSKFNTQWEGRLIEGVFVGTLDDACVCLFSYGCVTFWGLTVEQEHQFLNDLKTFQNNPLPRSFSEESLYEYGKETEINEEEDRIVLESRDSLIKLSLAHALSQAVKLEVFEANIHNTILATRHLPEELATKGKISLSRRKIAQKIGQLFAERNSINVHSDILDQPEFFWKRPRYEPYYVMGASYMDLSTRLKILNDKLGVVHELYNILSNELNHAHSAFLEMIIIGLIVVEVVLSVIHDILKWT